MSEEKLDAYQVVLALPLSLSVRYRWYEENYCVWNFNEEDFGRFLRTFATIFDEVVASAVFDLRKQTIA